MHRCGCRSISAAFIISSKHVTTFSKLESLGDYGPGVMLIQIQYVHLRFERADRSITTIVTTFIIERRSKLIQSLTHAINHHLHPSISLPLLLLLLLHHHSSPSILPNSLPQPQRIPRRAAMRRGPSSARPRHSNALRAAGQAERVLRRGCAWPRRVGRVFERVACHAD